MQKIELDELKKIELDILKDVAKFCDENNIRYYLAYGTLLGAVRHKGFIPWDDDIDIMMPRPDYEKFINTFNKRKINKDLTVCSVGITTNYSYPFAKVCNTRTTLREYSYIPHFEERGVYIDIFPLDNIPDDIKDFKRLLQRVNFYKKIYTLKAVKSKKGRAFYKEAILFFGRNIFRFINFDKVAKLIEKYSKKYQDNFSDFVGCIAGVYEIKKEKMYRNIFKEKIEVEFENELFRAPKDYHEYLTNIYGDYMTPPPTEERKTHHNFEAYWKD